jgi:hypothetical protein
MRTMTRREFESLDTGDIVRHAVTGMAYVVTDNARGLVTVVRSISVRHEEEWVLLKRHYGNGVKDGTEEKADTGGA